MVQKIKKRECPSCAMEVNENEEFCPVCQFHFPKRNPILSWVAIFLVILFLLFLIF
jgi:RNA polymerase subunit RPABC4/transcription elongation factor Spt4